MTTPSRSTAATAHPDLPGPGSVTWERMGRWATLSVGLRALVLQTAHPVVGAGVAEHSDFRDDFFPRFTRTLASTLRFVYGTPAEAAAEGRRLRALHARIRGTDHQGRPYRALDPQAYAWVHATLFEAVVAFAELTSNPLSADEQQDMYQEWKAVGTLLGVAETHLPDTPDAFWTYFHNTVEQQLQDNTVVRDLLGPALPGVPPPPLAPALLWRVAWPPIARYAVRVTVPTLPPAYLDRLGLASTGTDTRRTSRFFARTARIDRLLPSRYRYLPAAAKARRQADTANAPMARP
ncbi:oxygenase MpaB family protein [Streptomyces griseocarneus]|uniref:oxygenase MpaB family protein n=1 Tax=Streptomyces griseocarneus TaxID=51201 RepID=UPI00167E0205|nr:oxygenase MpaB family protein [Streptomyces griseocarneus]MBZ6478104.1 DUF2236 domain-containing protein [Streptomyces griseocarneus]GHG83719.1 hypothetical protein GCM10018779_66960 [Streptomyces griseocarneus]